MLPDQGYRDSECQRLIKGLKKGNIQQTFDRLNLNVFPHFLLDEARKMMKGTGNPKRNEIFNAAKYVGCPVLEVRDRHDDSAAARGALMTKDEGGDPWLIHAGPHTKYCDRLIDYLKSSKGTWRPRNIDYKIRDREEARQAEEKRFLDNVWEFIGLLKRALQTEEGRGQFNLRLHQNANSSLKCIPIYIECESDPIPDTSSLESIPVLVDMIIKTEKLSREDEKDLSRAIHFIQPDNDQVQHEYGTKKEFYWIMTLNCARLTQLLASLQMPLPAIAKSTDTTFDAQPVLHLVPKEGFTDALVYGLPVYALCGAVFVPTEDGNVAKPICEECEKRSKITEEITEQLRFSQNPEL